MTLQLEGVAARLPDLVARYRDELVDVAAAGLAAAEFGLARWDRDPEAGNAAIERAMVDEAAPYALAFGVAWTALLVLWMALGLRLGPAGPLWYP